MLFVIIFAALAGVLSVASTQNNKFTCGEPPDVTFASVSNATDEEYALGTIVTYECDIGYSFNGESRKISCQEDDSGDGLKWTVPRFFCAPQSCGDPGFIINGHREGFRFSFPNFVKYECDEGFKMKGMPKRYCQSTGEWSGKVPKCIVITCKQPDEIPNGRVTYKSLEYGSELQYTCNEGFILQINGTVYCTENGKWSKNKVECIETTCDFPVKPEHGTVTIDSGNQKPRAGTSALYKCDGNRVAYGSKTSKCLDNGQWLFPAPQCLTPCSVSDVRNGKLGIYKKKLYGIYFQEISEPKQIEDDEELTLRCSQGHAVGSSQNTETKISCHGGKWSLQPVCKPTHCSISELNFSGLQKGYKQLYTDNNLFQITCEAGYQINDGAELRCSKGEWKSNMPPCEPVGTFSYPTTLTTTISENSNFDEITASMIQEITVPVTTQSQNSSELDIRQLEENTTQYQTTVEPEQCSCQYPLKDENLIATVDGIKLNNLDKVSDGSVVVFRCQDIGVQRFKGPREMKCENCQNWNSSEFPTCSKPLQNDTVILHEPNIKISADGNLEVKKGHNLTLACIAYGGDAFPNWTVPALDGVRFSLVEHEVKEDRNIILYKTLLEIENINLKNEGAYNCSNEEAASTSSVTVTVFDPNRKCPELHQNDEIDIFYNDERRVNSQAFFSCRYQARELKGKAVVECLSNGKWSDPPPQCHRIKCNEIKETGQLKIEYQGDREIGSEVTYRCVYRAVLLEVTHAECMENGSWSAPPPECDYSPCELEDLEPLLQKKVAHSRHNVQNSTLPFPYNAEVKLTCEGDLIALGDPLAKCQKNGTWLIHEFRCYPGCPPIVKTPSSKLIIKPEKDVYYLEEKLNLSCPRWLFLTKDLGQISCTKYGWSKTTLPDCNERRFPPRSISIFDH